MSRLSAHSCDRDCIKMQIQRDTLRLIVPFILGVWLQRYHIRLDEMYRRWVPMVYDSRCYMLIYIYIYIYIYDGCVLDGVVFHLRVVLHIRPKLLDLRSIPSQENALECVPALLVDSMEHHMRLQDGCICNFHFVEPLLPWQLQSFQSTLQSWFA